MEQTSPNRTSTPSLEDTCLLTEVFAKLHLHPLVGIKMFVKNAILPDHRLDTMSLPFLGDKIKIYRMGSNTNFVGWRVSKDMAKSIEKSFHRLPEAVKQTAIDKSDEIFNLEKDSKDCTDLQLSRMLLGLYEHNSIPFEATISDYCSIKAGEDQRLRVSLSHLTDPSSTKVYADHTHVLIKGNERIGFFARLPIGTKLKFRATVHSYQNNNQVKYGIHDLRDICIV